MSNCHRPKLLDELVGQELIKIKARVAIGVALQRGEPLPHVLLTSSGGGLGKTTLAQILANEMCSTLVSTTGQCLVTPSDLRNVLIRLPNSALLLVDEFHCIGQHAAEELLLVLEEGVLNVRTWLEDAPLRLDIPPFTLIAATTDPSAIRGPLFQRFGLRFHFDFYPVHELTQVVQGMTEHLGVKFDPAICEEIAKRAMGVPRIALRLAEWVRDVAQARNREQAGLDELRIALELEGVDELGLRTEHRKLLQVLANAAPRAVSARTLALALGDQVSTITDVLEVPLIRFGLMTIGSGGRRITDLGRQHLSTSAVNPCGSLTR